MAKSKTKSSKSCPICGQSAAAAHAPFCSKRCADVDLGRWLGEVYAIPAVESEQTDDEE
ncbi:MAG: DNA gyrase inhibitor YacG [Alphaproteobacteria bacterium]|nr:MAG: DNA gyrase inhibitor YacG [Alphaproteobacteria bacterium]